MQAVAEHDAEIAASRAPHSAQADNASLGCSDPASTIAHLLSQVRFLHGEVERLEEQLAQNRAQQMHACKAIVARYEEQMAQQNAELRVWRARNNVADSNSSKSIASTGESTGELLKRCHGLEGQLAAAKAAQGVLQAERSDLLVRLRRTQDALRAREAQGSVVVTHAAPATTAESGQEAARLVQMVERLTGERAALQRRLADAEARTHVAKADKATTVQAGSCIDASTTTEAVATASCECQTSLPIGLLPVAVADKDGDAAALQANVYSLSHLLEEKARDCDALRARLEEVTAAQAEALRQLAAWRQRHDDAQERGALLSDNIERLSLQVRSLQQAVSEHAVTERELVGKLDVAESEKEQLRQAVAQDELAHQMREEQVRQMEKDLGQLVANKNYANEQIALLANENERLRAEAQAQVGRHTELQYTLRVKEKEVQEVLTAYQNCAKENEALTAQVRLAEKELAQARAAVATKEENVLCMQEQLQHLHSREQQLGLDVQSLEYEHAQLSQKLLRCEAEAARQEAQAAEAQQLLAARDVALSETRFEMAELSKQLVMKENELALLRGRCEAAERELQHVRAGACADELRTRMLSPPDSSGRLGDDSLVGTNRDGGAAALRAQLAAAKEQLRQQRASLLSLEARLRHDDEMRESSTRELASLRDELQEANLAKEQLQRIVLEQTQTLSQLAK